MSLDEQVKTTATFLEAAKEKLQTTLKRLMSEFAQANVKPSQEIQQALKYLAKVDRARANIQQLKFSNQDRLDFHQVYSGIPIDPDTLLSRNNHGLGGCMQPPQLIEEYSQTSSETSSSQQIKNTANTQKSKAITTMWT